MEAPKTTPHIVSKLSLINYAIFTVIFLIGTYAFWPEYYDQNKSADFFNKIYGKISHFSPYSKLYLISLLFAV